jgi:hypothetical protein
MKKYSSIIIIGILLLLSGISVLIYKKKGKPTTVDSEARNFKLKDTASITKIFIADKEGDKALLERTKKGWIVNNKYPCRPDAILNLMEAIRNVEVKMPVNKNAREPVLKTMASSAIKVEIYSGEELVKQYYVGHETQDSEGSYMLLTDVASGRNYDEPFVCFIPGFVGYLIPRFIAKENEWRDRVVINYIPPQIKQIKVEHLENPDSSFTIDLLNTTTFKLKTGGGKELSFDEFKMKQYLAYFQNLSYEELITGMNKKLQDSLATLKPFEVITVTRNDYGTDQYKLYHKQPTGEIQEHGVVFKYDPDRMYMRFAGDREWALIQTFVFGKLLVNYNYFLQQSVKK